MKIMTDIIYNCEYEDECRLDIYVPDELESNKACILFIHGGGWRGGQRKSFEENAIYFCKLGFTCFNCDYRLAPKYRYPAQIDDVRKVIEYIKDNQNKLTYDPNKTAVIGSSAGGHLAAMLGTTTIDDINTKIKIPGAVICYCPITTLKLWDDCDERIPGMLNDFIGASYSELPSLYNEASPFENVTGNEPPFLFLHGKADDVIPFWHSEKMHDELIKKGVLSRLILLEGVGHGFGYGIKSQAQVRSLLEIEEFLNETFDIKYKEAKHDEHK